MAVLWKNDLLSYLSPRHRGGLTRLLGPGQPVLVIGDRGRGFAIDGAALESALPNRERLVSLRVDAGEVMGRQLDVPRAAASALDAALLMNLEAWTPFAEGEVYACARPVPETRPGPSSTIRIEIRCAARGAVDDRIDALAEHGIAPDAIQLGDASFELARPTAKRRAGQLRNRFLLALGVFALVQVTMLHVLAVDHQSEHVSRLQAEQEQLMRALRQKAAVDRKANQAREALQTVAARLDPRQSVSHALEILAAALPADILVREIAFDRDRAEGTLLLASPKDLDIAGLLAPTGLYKTREIAANTTSPDGKRLYSIVFTISGWTPTERRLHR